MKGRSRSQGTRAKISEFLTGSCTSRTLIQAICCSVSSPPSTSPSARPTSSMRRKSGVVVVAVMITHPIVRPKHRQDTRDDSAVVPASRCWSLPGTADPGGIGAGEDGVHREAESPLTGGSDALPFVLPPDTGGAGHLVHWRERAA